MKNTQILYGSGLRREQQVPGPIARRGFRASYRLSTSWWPWLAIFAVIAIGAAAAGPVAGFSIDASLTNGTPLDRSDDLLDAARWSDRSGSYVEDNVRGLGGGLEYAISSEFCATLIPQFVDNPSCEDLRSSVKNSFDIWTRDNPKLRFEDVSGRVTAELPPSGVSDPWRGFGAEIDLLALSPDEYANVRGFGAWTQFWYLYADPMGTNGRILPGNSMTSADIIVNSQACFYLDPASALDGCNDFGFLLLHETGHVFALDHSNPAENGYFDTDDNPFNPIAIDCESPHSGLALSSSVDPKSVMNLGQWEPGQARMELSADERGALQFLYPVCSAASDSSDFGDPWE